MVESSEKPRVFVRQPLTRAGSKDAYLVQGVLDELAVAGAEILTGPVAQTAESFRSAFEAATGAAFSPSAFRAWRLGLLARAQAMVIVRTELSESGAFEVAYNSVVTRRPMFFAVHADMPITTTLLQDLEPLCPTAYVPFEDPSDLAEPLGRFLARTREASPVSAALLATRLEELRITVVTGLDTADPIVVATASALLTAQELLGLIAENNTGERAGELHHALQTGPARAGGVTNTVRARTDSRRVAAAGTYLPSAHHSNTPVGCHQ
jgi:carbamoyl-phosphate synthase large subunit